jgi:hypothetical protein
MSRKLKILTEIVQFVPIITLAITFIVKGDVDLEQAAMLFVVSGIMAVGITVWLVAAKVTLNPILLASNIWLVMGAIAFGVPVPFLATLLSQTNAALLFATVLLVGTVQIALKIPTGFIGMENADTRTVRRLSFILLALSAVILIWAFVCKDNIRLGGGLPFIILNVTRRVMIKRSTVKQPVSQA